MSNNVDDKTPKSAPSQPTSSEGEQEINTIVLADHPRVTGPGHALASEGLQELSFDHLKTSKNSPDELEATLASATRLLPEQKETALRLLREKKRIEGRLANLAARKKALAEETDEGKAALEKEALARELEQLAEDRRKLGVEYVAMKRVFAEIMDKLKHDLQVVDRMMRPYEDE